MLLKNQDLTKLSSITDETVIKEIINEKAWQWYHLHEDDIVASFFAGLIAVRVKNVRILFEKLFGPEPQGGFKPVF